MLQLDTLSACITVDGAELPQYVIENSVVGGIPHVTCWIASEAGKEFSVVLKDSLSAFDTIGEIAVDGLYCDSLRLYAGRRTQTTKGTVRVSLTAVRPFTFSRVQVTDDEHNINHRASSALGEIKLKISKAKLKKNKNRQVTISDARRNGTEKLLQAATIHERSKKAVGHHVQLGKEVASPVGEKVEATKIKSLGIFIFKYRPLDMLQANGIAPLDKKRKRSISPPDDSIVDNSDSEDAKRIKALEEELRALKEKAQVRNPKKTKKEVKEEISINWLPGEVIDLT